MYTPSSLPCPDSVSIQRLSVGDRHIVIELTACRGEVPCPDCAQLSHRLHSRYCRTLADLPLQDKAVSLVLHSRKFFCSNSACKTQIFTERMPDLVAPYARRTVGLQEALHLIGLALGGRAGAALAQALKMNASRDTVLHAIRCCACFECGLQKRRVNPMMRCAWSALMTGLFARVSATAP